MWFRILSQLLNTSIKMKWFTILTIYFILIQNAHLTGLTEEFTWSRISYSSSPGYAQKQTFRGESDASIPPENSDQPYIFENNIPLGANRWRNKLFITVPRRRPGIPSTLNFIWTNTTDKHNVPLIPYPNAEVNKLPSTTGNGLLVSVYRSAVDSCNRLWMTDTGLLEYPGNRKRVQRLSLIVIDLLTNQIIRRHVFKPSVLKPETSVANLVIDVQPNSCENAYAYMPDYTGFGILVYNFANDETWRVDHKYFLIDPLAMDFFIGGYRFKFDDGIFSIALSDVYPDGSRDAYFHSMAGTHTYSVSTNVLRNKALATRSEHGDDFKILINRGLGAQSSGSDLHRTSGLLFFGIVNQNALGCWNTFKPPELENFDVVYKNGKKFIYPTDVKVSGDDVIVLTNSMPVFLFGRLDYDQINFRVWMSNVYDAIMNTNCMIDL
ncbi:hypothetical protein FQR65_LT04034 [Abscondita terminalis]|nr:hypothetical protein FQR65_LT04034 [Abscondita terminalis]